MLRSDVDLAGGGGKRRPYQDALMGQLGAPPSIAPQDQGPLEVQGQSVTPRANTRLMEGDPTKLANTAHAAKSPKYDFLQLAQSGKYGYNQLGDMLAELQKGPNAQHWQGWTADRDKLRFAGDPSQLGSQWGGVTTVDTIGGFASGNPQGWRWGADDAGTAQAAPRQAFGGIPLPQVLSGDPLASIGAALAQAQERSPNLAALLAQLGV